MPEIPWFGDHFIGRKITFKKPKPSVWVLKEQISENETIIDEEELEEEGSEEEECEDDKLCQSEARAVFTCAKMDGNTVTEVEGIIKIHMQVPHYGTETKRASERAKQATDRHHAVTENELYALQHLTDSGCSSTPTLLSWKQTKQHKRGWVPGGYMVYFLMNKLPGIEIERLEDLQLEERNELRAAFKKAWIECRDLGVVNMDTSFLNLLWDRENQKCYIVDFDIWTPNNIPWRDGLYNEWCLTIYHGRGDRRP